MNSIQKQIALIALIITLIITPLAYKIYKQELAPKSNFEIELTYNDGYKDTLTYNLPKDSQFEIKTSKGSYELHSQYNVIKAGVIRYKLLNKN